MATRKNRSNPTNQSRTAPLRDEGLQIAQEEITNALDPHLQEVLLMQRANEEQNKSLVSETDTGEIVIDVIAKLKDPSQDVPGFKVVRRIGDILTGSVAISDIEAVRSSPNVVSLKRATELHHELNFSVPEIGADQASLRQAAGPGRPVINGRSVIVGVVDYDLDIQHKNFRKPDGTTRVLFLWDQQAPSNSMSPAGFGYGREFTRTAINEALSTSNPYNTMGYQPALQAHGTHVTDIAAGNGRATGNPGVAPEADIIFVQLHGGDVTEDQSFGNSRTLLEAADYIFSKARELGRPCVINMSLGTHGGPHDGSTLAEQGFDHLLTEAGRAIVIAAGNSNLHASHASGTLLAGGSRKLKWQIRTGDRTDNEMEIWYPGDRALTVSLVSPSGSRLGPVQPGGTVSITQRGERSGSIISRIHDPNNGLNQINVILRSSLPAGDWTVELTNTGTATTGFDAWIERDDFGQSRFAPADDDRSRTIGSISCGKKTIVVGSYQPTVAQRDISNFSSSGPTRDGRQKPEVSAPGDMIRAAASRTQGAVAMSGTSMAAPHVTGLVALLLQAAGGTLTCDQIRNLVMSNARRNPPSANAWDARYGLGRIGATATVLAALPAAPATAVDEESFEPPQFNGGVPFTSGQAFGHFLDHVVTAAERSRSRVSIHIEVEPVISEIAASQS